MWLDYTGRTLEQELGDGWAANIHPDDVRAVFQTYLKAFHAHELFELQYRLRHHDGQYRWIVERAAPFEDSEGKFAGYIGAFHDIHQDKQSQEELAMRQGQLEEAQALARLGSWSWDILTGALTWSDELYRVFGLDKEEFWPTHQGFCQLLHPDDRALFEVSIERALNSRQPYDCDLRIVCGDGSLRLLHSRGRVIFDKTRKPLRMFGMAQDITESKQAEEALRESEERFRQLAENIDEVFSLTDARTKSLIYVSAAYEAVWGRTCESLYKEPASFLDAIHPDDRAAVLERLCSRTYTPHEIEYRILRPDGSVRWISDRSLPIRDGAGKIYRCAGIARDITQHKHAEEALHKLSGRLLRLQDEANRRIARDLHDSTAQQLALAAINLAKLERNCGSLGPAAANLLSDSLAIIEQCNSELRTISYLLHPPLLDELGLNKALEHYVQKFSERSGIRVMIEARDSKRPAPEIEIALFRVAQESLVNIFRHSGSSTATICLSCDGDRVTLEVKDEGCGLQRIQLDHASEATASLGVGIAGMVERLRQLGGRLEIDSGTRGTTVRAVVPLLESMH
jgi:PAS domain S-box-containing protein